MKPDALLALFQCSESSNAPYCKTDADICFGARKNFVKKMEDYQCPFSLRWIREPNLSTEAL